MKSISKKLAIGSVNLLALGISAQDASLLAPQTASVKGSSQTQSMNSGELRAIEAAHLEVYAGCKWGHAAFDPIKVDGEQLSTEVQSIYNQMA